MCFPKTILRTLLRSIDFHHVKSWTVAEINVAKMVFVKRLTIDAFANDAVFKRTGTSGNGA